MPKRQNYNDEFRANALIMLEGAGYPNTVGALKRVANHLGLQTRTLRRWYTGQSNPPPDKVVAHIKGDFLERLQVIKGVAAEKIIERIEDFEPRDLTGLLKISAELSQLLEGKPTAINEERASDARSKLSDLISRRTIADRDSGDTEYIQ